MRAAKPSAAAKAMAFARLVGTVCLIVVLLATTPGVRGECPNGCSGNGDCMEKDMCNCYKNYQGNDCADRMCLFGRAHVDTPKGDINMDMNRVTPGWILANSQQSPAQTYEYFDPDAVANEAHFYMECSNKGICDRATGLCQCFDGYEGNGCQRTTCPGKCSSHGTCESVRELASKNGGTLFGLEGNVGAVKYDLWDANSTYGCRCDPWFFGPDCGKRNCKVGVDPLYMSAGNPRYETFVVHAFAATGTALTNAWIRLRVFDYFGESYVTKRIPVTGTAADDAAATAAAITGAPNLTFKTVTCNGNAVAGSTLEFFKSQRLATTVGMSITCQYTGNPGKMRIPEVASMAVVTTGVVVTTTQSGEDEDWFTTKSNFIVDSITGAVITLTATSPDPAALAGRLIKIGSHILRVDSVAGGPAPAAFTLTVNYALTHPFGTNPAIFVTEPVTGVTTTAITALSAALTVGSDKMIFAAAPADANGAIATGDLIFFENAFFYVQALTDNGVPGTPATEWYAWLHKPFGGKAADGADSGGTDVAYKVVKPATTKGYEYVSECSGRGLCNYDSGICACFKGYTNDNCNTQNILAL